MRSLPALYELRGLTSYEAALRLQEAFHLLRLGNNVPDTIIALQHKEVRAQLPSTAMCCSGVLHFSFEILSCKQ